MRLYNRYIQYAVLLLALSGCTRHSGAEGDVFTVHDDLGRGVGFDARPQRVVSLAPSFTEILYAIGADTLVAGVSSYCNYPPECASKPRVGSLMNPSIEAIVALDPDLVLVTAEGNTQGTYLQLEELGMKTFVANPLDLAGVLHSIRTMGVITGHEARANALADSLQAFLVPPEDTAHGPVVLMLLGTEPLVAAGGKTFLNELIYFAGARNATSGTTERYPVISRELIIQRNPDIILVPSDMGLETDYLRRTFPEWEHVNAIRNGAVYVVDGDVFMRPGPRLWQGLGRLKETVRKFLR